MNRIITLLLSSLLALVYSISPAQVSDEAIIRNIIDAYNIAYMNERLDIMCTYIDKNSPWFKDYEEDLAREFKENKFISVGFDLPLEIKITGNSANTQAYGFTYYFDEKDNFLWLFKRGFTYNFIKIDNQWKIESLRIQIYEPEREVELALHRLRKGDPVEAMNSLNKARETNDRWENAYFLQAFIIFHVGENYENALGGFLKTIEFNPNFELAYYYARNVLLLLIRRTMQ